MVTLGWYPESEASTKSLADWSADGTYSGDSATDKEGEEKAADAEESIPEAEALLHAEEAWLATPSRETHDALQAAEVAYCMRAFGWERKRAVDKTRNRMRTRRQQERAIGLPRTERTKPARRRKAASRDRWDASLGLTPSWKQCREEYPDNAASKLWHWWTQLPRIPRPPRARIHKGTLLTWKRCCQMNMELYTTFEMWTWFRQLQRAE